MDIIKNIDVDEHYVITSEVAPATQAAGLKEFSFGYAFGQAMSLDKEPQEFHTKQIVVKHDGLGKSIRARRINDNVAKQPLITFPTSPLDHLRETLKRKDEDYIKSLEKNNAVLEDAMYKSQKEAYDQGAQNEQEKWIGVSSELRKKESYEQGALKEQEKWIGVSSDLKKREERVRNILNFPTKPRLQEPLKISGNKNILKFPQKDWVAKKKAEDFQVAALSAKSESIPTTGELSKEDADKLSKVISKIKSNKEYQREINVLNSKLSLAQEQIRKLKGAIRNNYVSKEKYTKTVDRLQRTLEKYSYYATGIPVNRGEYVPGLVTQENELVRQQRRAQQAAIIELEERRRNPQKGAFFNMVGLKVRRGA